MTESTFCSLCGFTHGPHPDGISAGCGRTAASRVASPRAIPTPTAPALAEASATPVARPEPPVRELFSSSTRIQHEDAPTGARIAGAVLLVNVVFLALERVMTPAVSAGAMPGGTNMVSALIDLFIGYKLVVGKEAASVITWARLRVVLGALLITGIQVSSGNLLLAAFQLIFSFALLMLLLGDPGKLRIGAGLLVAGGFFAIESLGLIILATGRNPIAEITLLAQADGGPITTLEGLKFHYSLTLPTAGKWYLRDAALARKESPASDRWAVRPDLDAHVIVIAETLPSAVDVAPLRDVVVKNLQSSANSFEIVEEGTLTSPSGASSALLLRTRRTVGAIEVEGYVALFVRDRECYQVLSFTTKQHFAAMNAELKQIAQSFRLPPLTSAIGSAN